MSFQLLKYYQDVLGINFLPQHLLNEPEPIEAPSISSFWREDLRSGLVDLQSVHCDLLFVSVISSSEEESLFQDPSWGLFEKMKNAMGLQQIQIKTLEHVGSENSLFQDLLKVKTKVVVLFKNSLERRGFQNCPEFKFLETYSPQILLQNSSLKKEVWDDLQQVMKIFKN